MSAQLRSLILKIGGGMLVGLAVLHLAVTPLIVGFIDDHAIVTGVEWFRPPMVLNHVVVGILLIPLGILTWYAASPAVQGEKWALIVVRVCTLSVATLPFILFLLMGNRYVGAPAFAVATLVVSVASLLLLVAAFWPIKGSSHFALRRKQPPEKYR